MERPTSQYCVEDTTEFSLPEGVDLVGIDTSARKSASTFQHRNVRKKPPSWGAAAKLVVINLFVCALVLGYALVGSFVFLTLEGNKTPGSPVQVSASGYPVRRSNLTLAIWNTLQGEEIQHLKNMTVSNIWNLTMKMNILYEETWTKLTAEEVGNFQLALIEKVLNVVESTNTNDSTYVWTFPRAFLFALTTLTTIGYGGIGPKTSSAKIATMIYAIFGIPIMLWYLSNVGSLLAKIARFCCAKICCCRMTQKRKRSGATSSSSSSTRKVSDPYYHVKGGDISGEDSSHHHRSVGGGGGDESGSGQGGSSIAEDMSPGRFSIVVVLVLCIAVLLAYVCFGSYVVSRWEKWRFLDSFYFCFLTLTTISFGDIRAQRNGGLERFQQKTEWFCSFYILFGMALTSMFFNILHEEISHRFKRWRHGPPPEAAPFHNETKEQLATVNRTRRRPVENSYSVHFMNFSPNSGTGRNFTEETLLSNEMHTKSRSGIPDAPNKSGYDDDEATADYIVSHPIPPPREIYGSHPVFPR